MGASSGAMLRLPVSSAISAVSCACSVRSSRVIRWSVGADLPGEPGSDAAVGAGHGVRSTGRGRSVPAWVPGESVGSTDEEDDSEAGAGTGGRGERWVG